MNVSRYALLAALTAAAAACSFTEGFDGFAGSGGAADAGHDTGSSINPSTPGPGDDGGGQTDSGDAGSQVRDAADPNTPPVFVDGGSFCGTQESTTFCEDFDTTDLPVHWVEEGTWAKLTSYTPKSAPNGFLLEVPETSAGGTFVSKITRVMPAPSTNMIVAFDFYPEKVSVGTSFLMLAALEWSKGTQKYSMRLVYSSGSIRLEESDLVTPPNNKDYYHPFFSLPTDKWTRIKLDVVAAGTTPGVTLSLDGVDVGTREALTPTAGMDTTPTLILGAVFAASPHTGWTLRYDNLTVTYR